MHEIIIDYAAGCFIFLITRCTPHNKNVELIIINENYIFAIFFPVAMRFPLALSNFIEKRC